jgi:hypothetical protein
MDGSFAHNMPDRGLTVAIGALAMVGLFTIGCGLCVGAFWVLSHLHWVW